MLSIVKFLYLFSLVIWIGMIFFFSFFAAPAIFRVLQRETAGDVVGEIFPVYWAIGYVAGVTSLVTLIITAALEGFMPAGRIVLLFIMTGLTFYSGMVVGAEAREIKARIRVIDDTERKESLRREFKRLHGISSVLNMTVLALGVVVLFLTARTLGG